MKVVLRAKAGVFLGVSSVLVAWTLLAVHTALAQVRAPSCPSPRQVQDLFMNGPVMTLGTSETDPSWGESAAQMPVQDFAIRVPPLAAGELTVETEGSATVGRL